MKNSNFNKENSLILDLCKYRNMDFDTIQAAFMDSGMHLPYLLGQLQYNRLGGIACYTLLQNGILSRLNREFRNNLTSTYLHNKEQSESFLATETYLAELFKNPNIPYAFLKGAYLVQLYPIGLRTSNDFDILISPQALTEVEEILRAAKFVQGEVKTGTIQEATRAEIISSRMNRGETVPWVKQVDLPSQKFIEVDLNFSLDFQPKQKTNVVERMLADRQPNIITKNGALNTLATDDFLIHLCVHLFKEASVINWVRMGRDLSLYKFVDIYLFVEEFFNEDFSKSLKNKIESYGLQKECYYALLHSKKLFGMHNSILDQLLLMIQPKDITYLNQIVGPLEKKLYEYHEDFIDWVFLPNRSDALVEVKNETITLA